MRPRTLFDKAPRGRPEWDSELRQPPPAVSDRHRYRCWLCQSEGLLEFEPDPWEPSWTECHQCGCDIPRGKANRRTVNSGYSVGSRGSIRNYYRMVNL